MAESPKYFYFRLRPTRKGTAVEIEDASDVDVVEVIRCRDCRHYGWTENRIPEEQTWWCYKHDTEMGKNDYCSYAERREDDSV